MGKQPINRQKYTHTARAKGQDDRQNEEKNIVKLVKNYFITFYYLSQQYILYIIMIKIKVKYKPNKTNGIIAK